jgi:hypothetical protein
MSKILLRKEKDLDSLHFPDTEEGLAAKNFLQALMKGDTRRYIRNVQTVIMVLQIDEYFLPISINDEEYDNSYVVAPYGIIPYAKEELIRLNHRLFSPILLFLLKGAGRLFKWGKINKVVTVNNFLLSTNLYPELSKEQISEATSFLQKTFSGHAILWRSLNNMAPRLLLENFRGLNCRLLTSRQVYFYDPALLSKLNAKQRWNNKKDRDLLSLNGYTILRGDNFTKEQILRIKELYRMLYLDKYTPHNPQFSEEFLQLALEKKLLTFAVLIKDGRIDGVVGYYRKYGVMTTPIFGYETKLAQRIGLYRMLTSIMIAEAHQKKILLHHSSGASHFKRTRGMFPEMEYTAVFDNHLPRKRRLTWSVLKFILNKIAKKMLIRYKL